MNMINTSADEQFDFEDKFKELNREFTINIKKVEHILDCLLSMRETTNQLRMVLALLYKPIQVGLCESQQVSIDELNIFNEYPCPIYSKCSEKEKKIESMMFRLPSSL